MSSSLSRSSFSPYLPPNQAMNHPGLPSAKDAHGPQLRIVTGHGGVVNPFKQIAAKLSLDLR
jgi:hypothetical protein